MYGGKSWKHLGSYGTCNCVFCSFNTVSYFSPQSIPCYEMCKKSFKKNWWQTGAHLEGCSFIPGRQSAARQQKCFIKKIEKSGVQGVVQLVTRLPSDQVIISGSWDQVQHRVPCSSGSLLLPLPLLKRSLYLK